MRLRSVLSAWLFGVTLSVRSYADPLLSLEIPPGTLSVALDLLARQSHLEFIYSPDDIQNLSTCGVQGQFSKEAAVGELLKGTGLQMIIHSDGAILITRNPQPPPAGPVAGSDRARPPAEAPATRYDRTEQEIVVTAAKRPEPLSQVAGAVSAISGLQLEQQGANELADYVGFLPGVAMQTFGHVGYDSVFIRGIAPQSVGATTSTYVDNIPVGPASALTRGALFSLDLDPTDLERVEVLKGPQGTLYGASSLGGVIKYVTRSPDLSHPEIHLYEEVESTDGGAAGMKVRAAGSAPLIQDTLALRLSGYFRHVGGFIDDLGVGGSDTNRANERGGRATLLYRPVENLSLQIIAMDQQNRAHGNDVVDYNLSTGRPTVGPSSQFRYVPEPSSSELQLYSAELNYHLEWLDLVAASGYSRFHPVTIADVTQTLIDQAQTLPNPVTPARSSFDEPVSKLTQEIRLVAKRRGHFEWMLGGFFQHESLNSSHLQLPYAANGGPYVGPPFFAAYRVGTLIERAGFADVTAYFGANLDITAGARISRLNQTSRRSLSGITYNSADPLVASISQQAFSESADTYLLAARWRPTSNMTVYARAASGYRPGGARTVPPTAPPGLLDHYTSDSLWSYETGVKVRAFQERLHLDLAGFWINWTHIQALQPVGNDILVDGNAGTARSQGVELEARYSIREGLNIGANGAFTNARFTESVPLANITAGEPLQYVPRWTTTVFSSYSRPIGRGWRIQTDGDFQYQSTRVDLNRTALGAFSLWNARVALSDELFRVTLSIKNIANRQAFLGYGGDGFKDLYGFAVNPPRTVGLSFAQSF